MTELTVKGVFLKRYHYSRMRGLPTWLVSSSKCLTPGIGVAVPSVASALVAVLHYCSFNAILLQSFVNCNLLFFYGGASLL